MIVAKYRKSELISNYTILSIFALFAILHLIVLFFNSIKQQEEFGINPLGEINPSHLIMAPFNTGGRPHGSLLLNKRASKLAIIVD